MMRRRAFLAGVVAAIAAPRLVRAQARLPLVAFLGTNPSFVPELMRALAALGQVENRTFAFQARLSPSNQEPGHLEELARELVALSPTVLVTGGSPSLIAAAATTSSVPIVSVSATFLAQYVGDNFAKPKGNVTGVGGEQIPFSKYFELAVDAVPGLKKVGYLQATDGVPQQIATFRQNAQEGARALGLQLVEQDVASPDQIRQAIANLVEAHVGAVCVAVGVLFQAASQQLFGLTTAARLPTIVDTQMLDGGGLVGIGSDITQTMRAASRQVDRIIKGGQVRDEPAEQLLPVIGINRRTARAIGFSFPPVLIARADVVIE